MASSSLPLSIRSISRLGRARALFSNPYLQLEMCSNRRMVNPIHIVCRSASYSRSMEPIVPYPRNMFSPLSKSDQTFWINVLDKLREPRAVSLASRLDTACVLGVGDVRTWGAAHPAAFEVFKRVKTLYPCHVVMVRVGKFYEAIGFDAVLLVEYAGLNPMLESTGVPQAGCPASNIHRTLKYLLEQDLCVVMCEEIEHGRASYKNAKAKKDRFISQVLTPQNPTYLHGMVDQSMDPEFPVDVRPLFAISHSPAGFMTMEYKAESNTIYVMLNLTEESVWSQLRRQRVSAPIYLHSSLTMDNSIPRGWEQRMREIAPSLSGSVQIYQAADPIMGFCSSLASHFRWGEADQPQVQTLECQGDIQQPPPFSTMQAIGLVSTFGSCPLVDSLVTKSTPVLARSWLRTILMVPPPAETVSHIHSANIFLTETMEPIPNFRSDMQPYKIAQVVASACGSERFFRHLDSVLSGVLKLMEDQYSELHEHLIPIANYTAQLAADKESLVESCLAVREGISQLIPLGSFEDDDGDDVESEYSDEDGGVSVNSASGEENEQRENGFLDPLNKFFQRSRSRLVGRVHESCVQKEWKKLQAVERRITKAVSDIRQSIKDQVDEDVVEKHLDVVHDVDNRAVWLKIGTPLLKQLDNESLGLLHPNDRNAIRLREVYSSEELESALVRYRTECDNLSSKICLLLEELCDRVQPFLANMCVASCFATVTLALTTHMQCALEKGWILPDISRMLNSEGGRLELQDFWPYWMTQGPQTVTNSVDMHGMVLLTGCNMGGKSTVLRSIASICTLASCGLAVPAAAASIPFMDVVVLRTFLGDSQVEGQSAFAVEMSHMASVLKTATENSIVLVDELGKGTEVCAGASLCASMLKALAKSGCKGVFATHFHHLVDFFQENPISVRSMQMIAEKKGSKGKGKPSLDLKMHWKLADGHSRVSSGFQVALEKGVPIEIITRAIHLYEALDNPSAASSDTAFEQL